MTNNDRKRLAGHLVFLLSILLFSRLSAQSKLPDGLAGVSLEQKLNEQVPLHLKFRDENGNPVTLQKYFRGKPVLLTLVYYECPMLCTEVLNGVVRALRPLTLEVGKDFDILTVSFDPGETPELARSKKLAYLKDYGRAAPPDGWNFLVGDDASIKQLTESVGFRYNYDPATDQFAHAAGIMILTPQGKLSRYLYGVEYPTRDLRLALVEASENKIGSVVDQLLLFCFHYDPKVGKYSAYTLNIVRLGGVLTVIGLAVLILKLRK